MHFIFQGITRNFQELQLIFGTGNASQRKCCSKEQKTEQAQEGERWEDKTAVEFWALSQYLRQKIFNCYIYVSGSNILLAKELFCHLVGQGPVRFMCLPYLFYLKLYNFLLQKTNWAESRATEKLNLPTEFPCGRSVEALRGLLNG